MLDNKGRIGQNNWLAWDEEHGYADLASHILEKTGRNGWELTGVQLGMIQNGYPSHTVYPFSIYIFKKPLE